MANKVDLPMGRENLEKLKQRVDMPVFGISAKHKDNVEELLLHVREMYDSNEV